MVRDQTGPLQIIIALLPSWPKELPDPDVVPENDTRPNLPPSSPQLVHLEPSQGLIPQFL